MAHPTLVRSLTQEMRESKERKSKDQNRSQSPPTLYERRKPSDSRYGNTSTSRTTSDTPIYKEMTVKRQQERDQKERAIREKLGLGEYKRTNIFNEHYIQKKPTTLSSLQPLAKGVPSWLKEAAEKSDVTGLLTAYAKKKEPIMPEREDYIPQAHRTEIQNSPLACHPQYTQNNNHNDVYPVMGHQGFIAFREQHFQQQQCQRYPQQMSHPQFLPENQPRVLPQYPPNPNFIEARQLPDSNQHIWSRNDYPAQNFHSTRPPFPMDGANQWSNDFHPSYNNNNGSMNPAIQSHQAFGQFLPDATSTPQRYRDPGSFHPRHSSSTSSQQSGQQSSHHEYQLNQQYPSYRQEHHGPTLNYANIPASTPHRLYQKRYTPQADQFYRDIHPVTNYIQISPEYNSIQTEIPPAKSSVPTLQGTYEQPTMTPISSYQVQEMYNRLHDQSNGNTSALPIQVFDDPLQASKSDIPPPQLQQVHHDIVSLRKKNRKQKQSANQKLNKEVIKDLEQIAEDTSDELNLLRPDMLNLEDVAVHVEMASDKSHRNYRTQHAKLGQTRSQSRKPHPRTYHYTDSDESNSADTSDTDTDTSASTGTLSEDDIKKQSRSYQTSSKSQYLHQPRSRRLDREYHNQAKKRKRLTRKDNLITHTRSKRARREKTEYPLTDDTDSGQDDYDGEGITYEVYRNEHGDEDDEYIPDDHDMDEKEEEEEEPAPPRREPKPVKPLSSFADNIIIPSNTNTITNAPLTRSATNPNKGRPKTVNQILISSMKKGTNTGKKKKTVRFPSLLPAPHENPGEEIDVFPDEDVNMQDDEIELSQSNSQETISNHTKSQGKKSRRSENRWLRSYKDGDRLSTVEEEDEDDLQSGDGIVPPNKGDQPVNDHGELIAEGEAKDTEVQETNDQKEEEEEKFFGDGGDLGFKIWRDAY